MEVYIVLCTQALNIFIYDPWSYVVLFEMHLYVSSVCVFSSRASRCTSSEPPKGHSGIGPVSTGLDVYCRKTMRLRRRAWIHATRLCFAAFARRKIGLLQLNSIFKILPLYCTTREPMASKATAFLESAIKEAGESEPSPSPPGRQIRLIQIMQMTHTLSLARITGHCTRSERER